MSSKILVLLVLTVRSAFIARLRAAVLIGRISTTIRIEVFLILP
jgi:hypothetical protein